MKRSILIFGLLVLMNAASFGLDASCPVKITDLRNIAGNVRLLFRNASRQEITEYEFIVWFVDTEGQIHFLPVPDPPDHSVGAGQRGIVVYPAPEMLESTFSVVNAYLLHAAFANGEVWNDDGSHACSVSALQE